MDKKSKNDSPLEFEIKSSHPVSDLNYIRSGILEYNKECLGENIQYSDPEPVTIIVKDDNGQKIAGAFGYAYLNVFTVEGLFIEKPFRGQGLGRKISKMLQDEAEKRNCHTATLETFSFAHTKTFYKKIGVLFSTTIKNSPRGHSKYILVNKLEKDKGLIWKVKNFIQKVTY
jgi:GNAT superfamily N-acetyltransferase